MKRKLRNSLALIMAFQVLFSSTGLAFYEHSCLMSERTHLSYQEEEGCCEAGPVVLNDHLVGPQLKQAMCCESGIDYQHLETASSSGQRADLSFLQAILVPEPFNPLFGVSASLFRQTCSVLPRMNAPPRSGRDILNANCLLRI